MSNPTSIRPRFIALALLSALAACSNDYVDLGSGTLPPSVALGSRCAESVIVEGDVVVENQEQLDALLGCEEVRGNLSIQVFEDADLTALTELRAVDGGLSIGDDPEVPSDSDEDEAYYIEVNRLRAIAEANWLPSLAGVESLERVGGMFLIRISASSLDAFESLRLVGGGELRIIAAPNLVDLSGLDNARGFRALELHDNPALESLNGLQVGHGVDRVMLVNNPALTNIDALSSLWQADVSITGTAIANVDALANLLYATGLALTDNPELTNVDGLVALESADYLLFERNAKLERLPEFSNIFRIDSLRITSNPALESLSLSFPGVEAIAVAGSFARIDGIDILGNDGLTSVAFGANLAAAGRVDISFNANLAGIDLGTLRRIDDLGIVDNTKLTGVELGALQTVSSLSVSGNPLLPTTELRNVRTFESSFSENADDPPPAP